MRGDEEMTTPLRKAVGREIVLAVVGCVVVYGGMVVAIRVLTTPDAGRVVTMRAAKAGERYAMHAARVYANLADVCNRAYDKARPVNA